MLTKIVKPRYQTPSFEKLYRDLLVAAQDEASHLYVDGHGNKLNECFWHGFEGTKLYWLVPNTMSAVAYQAGKTFRKERDRVNA